MELVVLMMTVVVAFFLRTAVFIFLLHMLLDLLLDIHLKLVFLEGLEPKGFVFFPFLTHFFIIILLLLLVVLVLIIVAVLGVTYLTSCVLFLFLSGVGYV
jgi:hypothetical protein